MDRDIDIFLVVYIRRGTIIASFYWRFWIVVGGYKLTLTNNISCLRLLTIQMEGLHDAADHSLFE